MAYEDEMIREYREVLAEWVRISNERAWVITRQHEVDLRLHRLRMRLDEAGVDRREVEDDFFRHGGDGR